MIQGNQDSTINLFSSSSRANIIICSIQLLVRNIIDMKLSYGKEGSLGDVIYIITIHKERVHHKINMKIYKSFDNLD